MGALIDRLFEKFACFLDMHEWQYTHDRGHRWCKHCGREQKFMGGGWY